VKYATGYTDTHTDTLIAIRHTRLGDEVDNFDEVLIWKLRAGMSGNVLINENADRVNSYTVWDYAEGQDSYQNSLLVDLTQTADKVGD